MTSDKLKVSYVVAPFTERGRIKLYEKTAHYGFNPFLAIVPVMEKPGSWFLIAKDVKNTCGIVTF